MCRNLQVIYLDNQLVQTRAEGRVQVLDTGSYLQVENLLSTQGAVYCTWSLATLTFAVTTSGSLSSPRVRRWESWVSTTGAREAREEDR